MSDPARHSSCCTAPETGLARRVAGQSALLIAGFATAQGASFARNAIIGHWLSRGDFGIAASITLVLQLLEILSDLGADRLIVQARDGHVRRLMAAVHTILVLRGALTAAILYAAAAPLAAFFQLEAVLWAFQLAALVPLLRGFIHIDYRRRQRSFENRPFVLVEIGSQLAAAALAIPVLRLTGNYAAVVWLAIVQAAVALLLSHVLAARPYRLGINFACLKRLLAFGWPIWLSAFPLLAVYQGDRIIIAKAFGMVELAGYSAAFMITMVPGLVAARLGQALMLPLLARAQGDPKDFAAAMALMTEATALAAAAYLMVFTLAGGQILPLAFGGQYTGLGELTACLALMWALRMLQVPAGMALIARGVTRPLLTAGAIRALALLPALALALGGYALTAIALAGCFGELASLGFLIWRLGRMAPGLGEHLTRAAMLLAPVAAFGFGLARLSSRGVDPVSAIAGAFALALTAIAAGLVFAPQLRGAIRSLRAPAIATEMP